MNALDLALHQSVDLAAHALRGAGGIGHQLGKLIEKAG